MTTATTPNATNHAGLGPLAARLVRVDELPWEKTVFEGVEVKTLMIDRPTGLLTVLLKMAPGACLPDHEHVLIEQTYMLEGRLVDNEGPEAGLEVPAGAFVWRPSGSRHAAWAPEGALMLAIFQAPNRFHRREGCSYDMLGNDWEATWLAAVS